MYCLAFLLENLQRYEHEDSFFSLSPADPVNPVNKCLVERHKCINVDMQGE